MRVPRFRNAAASLTLATAVLANAVAVRAEHLYVADAGSNAVYRYAFERGGLPRKTPEAALLGLINPENIGFDAAGNEYVDGGDALIRTFSPLASGIATPLRTLRVRHYAGSFAVDANGYIYAMTGIYSIDVYAPGAHGDALPVHTMRVPEPATPHLEIGPDGRLFSLAIVPGIRVFDRPLAESAPTALIAPVGNEFHFSLVIGLARNDLLVHFLPNSAPPQYSSYVVGDFAVVRRDRPSAAFDSPYYAKDCALPGNSGGPTFGLAGYDDDVYLSCQFPSTVVFVYDLRHASRDGKIAFERFLGAPLVDPFEVRIGP